MPQGVLVQVQSRAPQIDLYLVLMTCTGLFPEGIAPFLLLILFQFYIIINYQ